MAKMTTTPRTTTTSVPASSASVKVEQGGQYRAEHREELIEQLSAD